MSETSKAAVDRIRAVREATELQKAGHTTLAVRKLNTVIDRRPPPIGIMYLKALRESWQARVEVPRS